MELQVNAPLTGKGCCFHNLDEVQLALSVSLPSRSFQDSRFYGSRGGCKKDHSAIIVEHHCCQRLGEVRSGSGLPRKSSWSRWGRGLQLYLRVAYLGWTRGKCY